MNRELFSLRPEERIADALAYLISLGISGAPVLDREGRAMGMLSFRDALTADADHRVEEHMNRPVLAVRAADAIAEAGNLMAVSGYHHLIATDDGGKAVGLVSSIDVVRGLLGLPAPHPAEFPHYDPETGLTWSDDAPFAADQVERAPAGPGLFRLVHGGRATRNRVLWLEASANVQERLLDLLTSSQPSRVLTDVLGQRDLWFTVASTRDLDAARRVASQLLRQAHGLAGAGLAPA